MQLQPAGEEMVALSAEPANFVGVSLDIETGSDTHGIKCWAVRDRAQNAETDFFAAHQYPIAGGVPMAYFLLPAGEFRVHCESEVLRGSGATASPHEGPVDVIPLNRGE